MSSKEDILASFEEKMAEIKNMDDAQFNEYLRELDNYDPFTKSYPPEHRMGEDLMLFQLMSLMKSDGNCGKK